MSHPPGHVPGWSRRSEAEIERELRDRVIADTAFAELALTHFAADLAEARRQHPNVELPDLVDAIIEGDRELFAFFEGFIDATFRELGEFVVPDSFLRDQSAPPA
jgi:hypothetical protein